MEFFKSVSVEEAKEIVNSISKNYKMECEEVSFYDAIYRTLSEDIVSKENIPSFSRSRMDGYSVKFNETTGASETMPSIFNLVGKVLIGETPTFTVNSGECAYVPTGAEIPTGADGIVMIEDTDSIIETEILVNKGISLYENITLPGEDISIDEVVIKKGTLLTPFHIGVLSSLGIQKVQVFKRPKISIISTGDELVPMEKEHLEKAEIRDINTYCLKHIFEKAGCIISSLSLVPDNYDKLKSTILKEINESDFIVMSGGSSVGERDYMAKLLNELGTTLFHGIRMKPGKPVLFGEIQNKAFFGLPGNPVSCILAAHLFVLEFINTLNNTEKITKTTKAKLSTNLHSAPGKKTFVFVSLDSGIATPLFFRSSMIKIMALADGYIEISEWDEGLYKDSEVTVNIF